MIFKKNIYIFLIIEFVCLFILLLIYFIFYPVRVLATSFSQLVASKTIKRHVQKTTCRLCAKDTTSTINNLALTSAACRFLGETTYSFFKLFFEENFRGARGCCYIYA